MGSSCTHQCLDVSSVSGPVCHRKIMDSGELDFYQHDKVCSNTCRSTKIDLSGARVSLSSPTSAEYIPLTPATADGMCRPGAFALAGGLSQPRSICARGAGPLHAACGQPGLPRGPAASAAASVLAEGV